MVPALRFKEKKMLNISLVPVTLPASSRSPMERKYRKLFDESVVPAPFGVPMGSQGEGAEPIDAAVRAGLMLENKRWNDENPDQTFFLNFRTLKYDSAGDSEEFAFIKTVDRSGKKRGRKAKIGVDDAPKVGEIYNG